MQTRLRTLFLTLWLAGAFFAPAALGASLAAPEAAGMRPIAEQVYVDPAMAGEEAEASLALLAKARSRVAGFYGQLHARPNIVFCATSDCYREFGGRGLGFTDGTNLVISPQGRRVAIIAHELAHVEFSVRVGGFAKVLTHVPQWFDEGQAVMVSMAEEFSDEAWKHATDDGRHAPALHALASMEDWARLTGSNGENMQLTYGTAKREVSRWFRQSGEDGFRSLLRALFADEPFAEAYARIESGHGHDHHESGGAPHRHPALLNEPMPAPAGSFARTAW